MVEATMGNRGSTETEVIDGVTNSKRIDLDVSARDENTDVSTSAQAAKSSSDLASEAPPKTIQLSEYPEAETATVSVASDEAPSKRKRRAVDRGMYVVQETVKKTRTQKPKKKKQVDTEAEFETAWICVECKEAECMMQPEATELLVCDGLCRRLFHYPCAGLERLPTEDEAFMCEDCKKRIHQCAICSNYGMDEEDVFKCSKDDCGLFFHESCLAMQNVEIEIVEDNVVSSTKKGLDDTEHGDTSSASTSRYFVCPAHNCWTCTQIELKEREKETDNDGANKSSTKKKKNVRGKKKARLPGAFESKNERFMTRCLECPISYHISCIPPSARFHELATLCHEHSGTSRLPELDPGASIQDQIEKAIDQKFDDFVDRRKRQALADRSGGKNVFFPGMSGDRLTKRESQLLKTIQEEDVSGDQGPTMDSLSFCLPCDIKDEVHSKPPNYRHVHALKYDTNNKPPRVPVSADVCQCVGQCGDDCINRMLYTECFGGATSSTNGSKKACNCNVGPNCGNRQLGQRKAAKCVTKREQGKGWGLVTVNKANKGDLIQEYIGEVIDTKTKEQRLTEWTEKHPNDPNFYIMALQPGWFIDAREVANLARFVNHSCEPNCRLTQINVNGRMHCGIFAKRDIEPGEFLSYDYCFDTRHGDRFVCRCGSSICRGTMKGGGGPNDASASKKSKSELWEEAKAGYERDKKFLADFQRDQEERGTQVGALVPGADSGKKEEFVANGAQVKNRDTAMSNRIFLWRNASKGSDFAERFERLDKND